MLKPKLRVGLIGSGFMGKAHAFGYSAAARVFDLPYELELHTLADINLVHRFGESDHVGGIPFCGHGL